MHKRNMFKMSGVAVSAIFFFFHFAQICEMEFLCNRKWQVANVNGLCTRAVVVVDAHIHCIMRHYDEFIIRTVDFVLFYFFKL